MFWTLIEKEWKNVARSPKFVATCGVSCLLILASVLLGIRELRSGYRNFGRSSYWDVGFRIARNVE